MLARAPNRAIAQVARERFPFLEPIWPPRYSSAYRRAVATRRNEAPSLAPASRDFRARIGPGRSKSQSPDVNPTTQALGEQ